MPRKAYIADLKRLSTESTSAIDGISDVRSGDDDGEFRFKITPLGASQPYEISALIPDVSDYPASHVYHIFSTDDNAPPSVGATLNNLPNTMGKDLPSLLDIVSKAFSPDTDGDTPMMDSHYDDDEEEQEKEEDFSEDEYGHDDFFGGDSSASRPTAPHPITGGPATASTVQFRDRIRSDLKAAKLAGFKVGHQGSVLEGAPCYVSISCRISKLGISEEAMQAWELEPSQYLILLIHYPNGYRSVDYITGSDLAAARRGIELRVGLSSRSYKPSLQEAIGAFAKLSSEEESKADLMHAKNEGKAKTSGLEGFHNSFISRPLNELLNERLATIIKYRYIGMCWTGAEEFYNDTQGKAFSMSQDSVDSKYMAPETTNKVLPQIVTSDHLADSRPGEPHSFPLLAMQFVLRHFVRCTEFCLVCHSKLEDDLEALKPYVCEKPLCLYQYMSLGFGPSIEHEIISQPYVVDLLISFCYQSAVGGKLTSFPTGLGLNVPPRAANDQYQASQPLHGQSRPAAVPTTPAVTPGTQAPDTHKAKFDRSTRELLFDKGVVNPVRVGDWICYNDPTISGPAQHARVIETALFPTVRLSAAVSTSRIDVDVPAITTPSLLEPNLTPSRLLDLLFFVYNTNFDTLDDNHKRGAIVGQLDLLPSVLEIKEYLTRNRMATLSSWTDRISPAASGFLRWIIASNRACIVQVDRPDQPEKNLDARLQGMDGWMQFRFAMGAPDKERRFMESVTSTATRLSLAYPTLFAWHGSPLANWHSIIREGLHFNVISHGRAFGNGCYHSMDFNTSFGYSGMHHRGLGGGAGGWPSSLLKISCAMALNEIVNAPQEYVSRNPHLVVAQLDWIQTRHLFVQCNGDIKPSDTSSSKVMHAQDPNMTPNGQKGKIMIPIRAMPKSRRPGLPTTTGRAKKKVKGIGSESHPVDLDDDDAASIVTDIEDLNIMIDEDISFITPAQAAQTKNANGKHGGFFSGIKAMVSSSKPSKSAKPMTDFVPGQLDYSTLPLMDQPSFASTSATRRLQKDFQALLKVQESQPLHELGWFIDPDQFSNVYQWIIEFHSFEEQLPLAKQMKSKGIKSVVMEMRFGPDYPMSPPFVRVIRPRFLSFMQGGGGHVTAGGAICMELLTNSGWSAVSTIESVLLQVRLAMSSTDPRPAKLEEGGARDYQVGEAIEAYIRACQTHGWQVPAGFREMAMGGAPTTSAYQ